jgi:uncharacterized membrane protein
MLVHFPVALWPAHACLHIFSAQLPSGAAATVGFWLLLVGTILGWLSAFLGLGDLLDLRRKNKLSQLSNGLIHALVNGVVLNGFTAILALEYRAFPAISHGGAFLIGEVALLLAMGLGNYFGGAVIWGARAE